MTQVSYDEIRARLAFAAFDKALPGRLSPTEVLDLVTDGTATEVHELMETPVMRRMTDAMFIFVHIASLRAKGLDHAREKTEA